ncbi:unnamed protein product [Pipistrellus nathusii]|uniref:Uteroglobin n=1 Tax=Pipistrellus nathusii TaxID=59473 RepID=A0ABP0AIW1_PIPNA
MKLALPLLLVTLALCCPDANAGEVCPALNSLTYSFMLGPIEEYQRKINKLDAPAEAIQAIMNVKTCVDEIPGTYRLAAARFVQIVENKCKKQSA